MANQTAKNQSVFDRVAHEYVTRELYLPERRLLELLKDRWHEIDMLDLGVGTGRTAFTFAAIVRKYIGVDYSARMIEWCLRKLGENKNVKFLHADATDLSALGRQKFDVILFSYNGIDYVEHEQRLQIYRQVRERLHPRDSYFFFSSHSLLCFPFRRELPKLANHGLIRWLLRLRRELGTHLRIKKINASHDKQELRKRGWAILKDGAHGFDSATYYITPEEQVRQLDEAGFRVLKMYDPDGNEFTLSSPPQTAVWLHYLCQLKS